MGINVETNIEKFITPEQRAAIQYMEDNKPPSWIFEKIAKEVKQAVPDGTDKPSWKHGSYRVLGNIDGYSEYQFENGLVPKDIDLAKISYVVFWRQAVANKKTKKVKAFAREELNKIFGRENKEQWTEDHFSSF